MAIPKAVWYFFLLIGIFVVLYSLDAFLGLHYEPAPHGYGKTKTEQVLEEGGEESRVVTSESAEQEPKEKIAEEYDDPYFNDEMKKYYLMAIFIISAVLAYRTFRNEPTV